MGSTTFDIHMSLPNNSVFLSSLHQFQAVISIRDLDLIESFNINTIILVFMNEIFLVSFAFIIFEEIHKIFIVKL